MTSLCICFWSFAGPAVTLSTLIHSLGQVREEDDGRALAPAPGESRCVSSCQSSLFSIIIICSDWQLSTVHIGLTGQWVITGCFYYRVSQQVLEWASCHALNHRCAIVLPEPSQRRAIREFCRSDRFTRMSWYLSLTLTKLKALWPQSSLLKEECQGVQYY